MIHRIQHEYMTDEEHTTAPTKSPIQLFKTQSTSLRTSYCIFTICCATWFCCLTLYTLTKKKPGLPPNC